MKIKIVEEYYDYSLEQYVTSDSDVMDVTEDEYELLKPWFNVSVLQGKEWYISEAKKKQAEQEAARIKYEENQAKRKVKAAETAKKRKLKQLEKLKKEFGME